MAHPGESPEAVDVPATPGNAVDDFAQFLDELEQDDEIKQDAPDGDDADEIDVDEGDEPEDTDDTDDVDEPATAIEPPVSFNKEQKAAFAQLPPELQQTIADTEAQRNREVQLRTTEAAEAKRNAAAEAQSQLAAIQRQYADELATYAQAFDVQEPDYSLIASDPELFAQQMAYYKQATAQRDDLAQRSAYARQQAEQAEAQHREQAMRAEVAILTQAIPEWSDPAKRQALLTSLEGIGKDLGYSDEAMTRAGATDIVALKRALDWKAKAEKYDALQSRKMAAVRAAKELPKVMKPNSSQTRADQGSRRTEAAWQRAKQTRSADDFAAYLETSGII